MKMRNQTGTTQKWGVSTLTHWISRSTITTPLSAHRRRWQILQQLASDLNDRHKL
jgi:hypothetical protein